MKPILFNTDMVRAILADRKTVTRRAVKLKYSNTHLEMFTNKYGTRLIEKQNEEPGITTIKNPDGTTIHTLLACIEKTPPYRPGDILYVQETWCDIWSKDGTWIGYEYRANGEPNTDYWGVFSGGCPIKSFKWRPSIHMCREASRIFLWVTDVRVERLHEITDREAIREGCEGTQCNHDFAEYIGGIFTCTDCMNTGWLEPPTVEFMQLWNSTIKPADRALYSWEANPWVWVIEFERCEQPKGDGHGLQRAD